MDPLDNSTPMSPMKKVNPFDFFSALLRANSDQVIHMVLYFEGSINPDPMQRAVMGAVLAEPVCHSRLVEADDTLWWESQSTVNPADCFSFLENTGTDTALYRALSEIIDPCQCPQIKVILIRAIEEKGDVLVINASHVAMDGRGLKDMARLIMELYCHSPEAPPSIIDKKPVINRDLPLISSVLPYPDRPAGIKELKPGAGPWFFPLQSSEIHHPAYAVMTIPGSRVASIHATRKELGVTVNDLMLAVIAIACANLETGMNPPYRSFLNTIDLRRYCPVHGRSVTNYSTAFEVRIPVKSTDTLSGLCSVVHEIMGNKKSDRPGQVDALDAEQLWKSGISAARVNFHKREKDPDNYETKIPIFTNIGIIDLDRANHSPPHVKNAILLPCHALPPVIFIAISTYRDTMTISSTYQHPAVANEQVRKFYDCINRLLPGYPGQDDPAWLQLIP